MRKKILLKLFFLIIIYRTTDPLGAIAQERSGPARIDTRISEDSIAKTKIRLPYSINVLPKNTTASTQAVYNQSLIKHPVNSVFNALPGRLAGLLAQQISGQPGFDAVSLSLHGRTPVMLVDGIPRTLNTFDLEEVESVTILKDAMATALLGVRGANGAVLITTRQGTNGKETISFGIQTGIQQPLKSPKTLSAFDYATLRNEAVDNELSVNPNFNTGLKYSAADLQAFSDGSDPIGHPNNDFRDLVLKSSTPITRYSLNMTGGSNTVTYFASLEHLKQDGLFKTSDVNKYNTNNYLSSYLIRSNININIDPKLTAGIHLFGRIGTLNEPGATTNSIYSALLNTPNNAYPILNPNGSYGGTANFTNNIQGLVTGSGYRQTFTRDILADFTIKRTLDEITPGLYVKGLVSYASYLNEDLNRSKPVVAYQRSVSSTGVESYGSALTAQADQLNSSSISNTSGIPGVGQGRQSFIELSAGYDRKFDNDNDLNVVLLANSDNNVYGSNIAYNVAGISMRSSYTLKERYIAEVAATYNGSNYYSTSSHYKFGFFPVAGLGWNIHKEDFMQSLGWVNTLKLSANYGKTGNDNPGYFSYLQRIDNGANAIFGTGASGNTTLGEFLLANPNITWEKANKLNVSIEGTLFTNRLGFDVDYYNNKFNDVLTQRGRNSSLIGITYPNENIGRYRYTGFDFQLSWQQPKKNNFSYYAAANLGLQQSKVLFIDEVDQRYPWMQRTGQRVGQAFGFVADGLFQSAADIANAAANGVGVVAGYIPQPGDIKYKDLNGDKVINQFDVQVIGQKGPLVMFGADLGFSYKFLDISALVQGTANNSVNLANGFNGTNIFYPFQNNGFGQAFAQSMNRFTPATAATATAPRVGIGNNVNNQTFSSFYFRRADYIRLKNVEVGLTLPARYANSIRVSSVRIFANGTNLLTATKLKEDLDPEVYLGYPVQKIFNFGVKVKI